MKIVFLDAYTLGNDVNLDTLKQFGNLITYDRTPEKLILERADEAEIVIVNKCPLNQQTLSQLPKLKYIGVAATGYNVVDTEAANALGITVTNAKNYSTNSVAQHIFGMMLEITNKMYLYHDHSKWVNCKDFCYYDSTITELAGKTFGSIGYGNIGKKTTEIAKAFGMNVLISKRSVDNSIEGLVPIETLLKESDFISLNLPLTEENQQFINRKTIALMKPDAVLINTSRGGLINEKDLAEALKKKSIRAAGLDVLSVEPPTADNPLLNLENCFITPHIAWASIESRRRLVEILAENIKAYLSGQPVNVIK